MSRILKFPENFYWGASTASYQVEGGIDNNDWAQAARDGIVPHAGVGADHYNLYEKDFDLAKSIGHNAHRISIEWSRIEPREGEFDMDEIEHYRKVLQALHSRGITPFVTLWHFTLPLWFVKKGGFEDKKSPEIFSRYCEFVFKNLSDHCVNWSTMNEPIVLVSNGYFRKHWPPFKMNPFLGLRVINNLAKAHNLAYKKIKKMKKPCEISIVKNNLYFSADWKPWNIFLKSFAMWFWNHRFLLKIYKNLDAIGLNYYFHQQFGRTHNYVQSDTGWDLDAEGIFYVLNGLKGYRKPIYITEAGVADANDDIRADYIRRLVFWIHKAIENGVDVRGYMYWSLIDNYEWRQGFAEEFGLIHINSKTKERIIRPSAYIYKKICEDNALTIE